MELILLSAALVLVVFVLLGLKLVLAILSYRVLLSALMLLTALGVLSLLTEVAQVQETWRKLSLQVQTLSCSEVCSQAIVKEEETLLPNSSILKESTSSEATTKSTTQ